MNGDPLSADVQMGYLLLLEALASRTLPAAMFRETCVALWIADRDAPSRPRAIPTSAEGRALLEALTAGGLTPARFMHDWCSLWTYGDRPRAVQRLLDELHSSAYLFTDDPQALAEDPAFFIGEDKLREDAERVRRALAGGA